MYRLLALLLLPLCLVGCVDSEPIVHQLPSPSVDVPTCNIPLELRQRNWLGPRRQGSCVYASTTSHAQWLNMPELAQYIAGPRLNGQGAHFGDGETETGLIENLGKLGLDYSYTRKADPRFLDWCDAERRGCILWWKPYHCCTFCGWITRNGKQYAVILDNNRTEDFELTERNEFIRLWAGYGGFALCIMHDPSISVPYPSYYVED